MVLRSRRVAGKALPSGGSVIVLEDSQLPDWI